MILGFAGRCRSGKTELAKVCEGHGYKIMSFAIPLKQLCADILSVDLDKLNNLKNEGTEIQFVLDDKVCKFLSDETDIPIEITMEICNGKMLYNVRHMLQFIGTDYIRKYNKDWHVNKLRKMIQKDDNIVFDDVRFKNEKKMIESLGGDCWFVIRPQIDVLSNHESETSIKWKDCFNKIIINDGTLECLKFKWENFLDNYSSAVSHRDEEFDRILEACPKNRIEKLSALDMLFIPNDFFTYNQKEIMKEKVATYKLTPENSLMITYKDGTIEMIYNMLVIEDLKMLM